MMSGGVTAEDITVPWGQAPNPLDQQTARWRVAVYQDLQASVDGSKLYWLYDPLADESSGTTGSRKGGPCVVVFDTKIRCFVREIPLNLRPNVEGVPKYFFALKCPSPAGGTALVLCTQVEGYGGNSTLQFWRVNLTADGLNLAEQLMPLLNSPMPVGDDWIVCMREDSPELALLTGPGLTVFRINAMTTSPCAPIESFGVPDGDMQRYYDGFIWRGSFYLLAAMPDGTFDCSHVHILDITGRNRMVTRGLGADPQRGMPPARKQAALDIFNGFLLLSGGETENPQTGLVGRMVDYWTLNLASLEWRQVQGQMPLALIEPRLTVTTFGQIYMWGDNDSPLPGVSVGGTHLRIWQMTGFASADLSPPSYDSSTNEPPAYPATGSLSTHPYPAGQLSQPQQQSPYPVQTGYPAQQHSGGGGGYPVAQGQAYPTQQSAYPSQQQQGGYPQQGSYPQQGGYPTQQQGGYPTQQQGGYPPQQQGGYPPQQQGAYPPQQQGAYPPQQQYPYSGQPSYPAQQGPQHAYYPPDSSQNSGKKDCVIC